MSEKTLTFENIEVIKEEFHQYKQPVDLNLVETNKIVICDRFKHTNDDFKYFYGYKEDNIIRPLCIILTQMRGHIKQFENGGETCLS